MIIETERLRIVPLKLEQFHLLLTDIDKLEESLDLVSSGESLDPHTQQAMEGLYNEALNHKYVYWWYTNWQIILKSENRSIGSACFTKEPDIEGNVEIGYGISYHYRNNGYMTEAVICMCQWALSQENVKSVVAETEVNNYSSQRVLEKSGMEKYAYTDTGIRWRIKC